MSDAPGDDAYEWYQRGLELLENGSPDAAAMVLQRLIAVEPHSASAWEAYGRALFDARRYGEAVVAFSNVVDREPDNDYGHYALGMALWRQQQFVEARNHLGMAAVMRPTRDDYRSAFTQVKATIRARREAGLALDGPVHVDFGKPGEESGASA